MPRGRQVVPSGARTYACATTRHTTGPAKDLAVPHARHMFPCRHNKFVFRSKTKTNNLRFFGLDLPCLHRRRREMPHPLGRPCLREQPLKRPSWSCGALSVVVVVSEDLCGGGGYVCVVVDGVCSGDGCLHGASRIRFFWSYHTTTTTGNNVKRHFFCEPVHFICFPLCDCSMILDYMTKRCASATFHHRIYAPG